MGNSQSVILNSTLKCSACKSNQCEMKHENRDQCTAVKENVTCRCRCAISEKQYCATHGSYVAGGVASAAGKLLIAIFNFPSANFHFCSLKSALE